MTDNDISRHQMTDYTIDPGATIDRLIAERDAALETVALKNRDALEAQTAVTGWARKYDALQQRLTAADVLEGLVRDAQKAFNYDPAGSCYNPGIAFVKSWSVRAIAALKQAEGGGDETQ